MRFTPKYTVSYRGELYYPDEEFDVDPADELEMIQHGKFLEEYEPSVDELEKPVEDKPRRGRRRKNDEPGEDASADE